ncbi:hypothetical protein [Chitinolyticbacter meiyuanensis]|uniref:hypothetical protein n=1 Tax=Chitinolyticbacter meiyuanensis TaxID=682798 RepID=UPI0011E5AA9B|nr:hypothetical protein [Chitinolyticbacter meiyuanensis]
MKTDRELLELAAKAAGLNFVWFNFGGCGERPCIWQLVSPHDTEFKSYFPWNPLEDDGDALRLAVRCRIDLDLWMHHGKVEAVVYRSRGNTQLFPEQRGDDSCAAARRAIVRAAAAIGEAMSDGGQE